MAPTGTDNERVPLKLLFTDIMRLAQNEFSISESVRMQCDQWRTL